MHGLTGDDVAGVLRLIASGDVPVKVIASEGLNPRDWFGDVELIAAGWSIVVFFDCGERDYVDSAVAPDGRSIEFTQMWESQSEPLRYLLTPEELEGLDRRLADAPVMAGVARH